MTESNRPFRVVLRGYEPAQVDQRVRELAEEAEVARQQARELTARVQHLEDERAHAEQDAAQTSYAHLGERVGQILTLAEEEAAALRADVRKELETERAQSQQEIDRIREDADGYAEQRRADSESDAARTLQDARRTADDQLDAAERDASARLQEAEAVYENQRSKAAQAAADFERTLAERRERVEREFTEQAAAAQQRLDQMERHLDETRAEAEQSQADAARESRRLIEDAQQQAEAIVRDARAHADRVRTESDRELAAATQRRDSINAQLTNVRQMLTTLSGVAPSAMTADEVRGAEVPAQPGPDEEREPAEADTVTDSGDVAPAAAQTTDDAAADRAEGDD